ncbi:fasciclin-like arabinogalactan protein 6 [Silene latifolia]|uniref:fasciclin-like arabinogalactan protein 6 n=1 Tax=Silene latifolia TaxID=37657 RepID=UPI003D77ECE0
MTMLRLSFLLIAVVAATTSAQPTAPTPAPTGAINLTAILEKGGQFTTFIRLLNTTQVGQQVENQVNNSNEGMTVFAPTDNAFQNLKPGTINGLTNQQQVQLILYHVLPKFYTFESFQTASNPVRTQATGNDGKPFGLTVTYLGVNNVNVSTGVVTVTINNALRSTLPLAVYQVDKVLLPEELFGAKAPKSSPSTAEAPESDSDKAKSPTEAADNGKSGAYGVTVEFLRGIIFREKREKLIVNLLN